MEGAGSNVPYNRRLRQIEPPKKETIAFALRLRFRFLGV